MGTESLLSLYSCLNLLSGTASCRSAINKNCRRMIQGIYGLFFFFFLLPSKKVSYFLKIICVSSRQNETFCGVGRIEAYAIIWNWVENIEIFFNCIKWKYSMSTTHTNIQIVQNYDLNTPFLIVRWWLAWWSYSHVFGIIGFVFL